MIINGIDFDEKIMMAKIRSELFIDSWFIRNRETNFVLVCYKKFGIMPINSSYKMINLGL